MKVLGYTTNILWTVVLILLSSPCESGTTVNFTQETATDVLTTTEWLDSYNTTIETNTTHISSTTITPEFFATAVRDNSSGSTSPETTPQESTGEIINTTTSISSETTSDKESTTISTNPSASTSTKSLPTSKMPQRRYQNIIQCQCGPGEVATRTGQCQAHEGGTTVPAETQPWRSLYRSTTDFNVSTKEPNCTYKQINLQGGEFMIRNRGDLLVFAGLYRGFRVAEYCVHHELVEGKVEVTARGCVPRPVIPRCCPQGEHMDDGECVQAPNTTAIFNPYLGTASFDDTGVAGVPFPWDDRQERIENLTCAPGNMIKKFVLEGNKTYLATAPKNVLFTFITSNGQRQYRNHQFCVDVQENNSKYHAHSCERDLEWTPEAYCEDRLCTYKCCPEGQAMSFATRGCVPSNTTFTPPFPSETSSLETLYGMPRCGPITNIHDFQLLQNGNLIHRGNSYPISQFCLDNFIMGNKIKAGALSCSIDIKETTWHMVRKMVFPVCMVLSCVALVLLILLHLWIPKLREKEGRYQLFHAVSLLLAYSVTFAVQLLVPKGYIMGNTCIALAFVMQFAFLSAFFWLNTMCFDVWRLFRNLVRSMFSAHITVALWKYLLYALGGPLIITVITIIIQYAAPKDGSIPGLIHPHIGEGRCWFRSSAELTAYFYGPIGVLFLLNFIFIGTTYYYLKIIRGDYRSKNDSSEYTINSMETTRKYDFFSAFWQRFYLLALVATCWLTEILSFMIPPEEVWAATDILNNLQGVFVFFIFLAHHNKRALLKEKVPKLFKFTEKCIDHAKTAQTSFGNSTKKLSRKISTSSILSNVTSFSSFSSLSTKSVSRSSFSLSKNGSSIKAPSTGIRSLSLVRKLSKPLDPNTSNGTPLPEIHQNHV